METKSIFKEIAEFGVRGYNTLNPLRKLKALSGIIEMIYDLSAFKNNLSGLLEKQQDLNKLKQESKKEIKEQNTLLVVEEAKKKAILSEIEELEGKISFESRLQNQKIRTQIEELKKKEYKVQSVIAKIELAVTRERNLIEEYKVKIPFIVHPTQLLGKDRNGNQYFFFSDEPTCVYIRMKSMDENIPCEWRCLKSEVNIFKFLIFFRNLPMNF